LGSKVLIPQKWCVFEVKKTFLPILFGFCETFWYKFLFLVVY
jgi:hypothetical protein